MGLRLEMQYALSQVDPGLDALLYAVSPRCAGGTAAEVAVPRRSCNAEGTTETLTRTVPPKNSCTECCSCISVKLPEHRVSCGENSCLNVGACDGTADGCAIIATASGFGTSPFSPCSGNKVGCFFSLSRSQAIS